MPLFGTPRRTLLGRSHARRHRDERNGTVPGERTAARAAVPLRRCPVSTPHAIAVPAGALEALRQYMGQAEIDAILAADGPLTVSERRQLGLALRWWEEQHAMALARIRAITACLSASASGG